MKLATVKRQVEAVVAKDPRFPPSHLIWKRMIILNRVHEIVKKQSGPLSFFFLHRGFSIFFPCSFLISSARMSLGSPPEPSTLIGDGE